ncbi:UDP-N-acetylmuramoyl-tripeptide--D-alanyl-D-alanine ligase [uncultured Draconibacterium sp.]|uniref:UDP-N-acetylmuramoyl-tripeptide--D-alanyl-D- alanine ligase n=1 Tax=uncultured Draconibacterium sp. TaxID=1573823 RepID=UPI0029C8F626|nr:UDP-N-acetylmuramoyl-tripeptide--D-alanyl-D-alanine ligase [uncultured Draconibacterium sp.]
MTSIETIYGCFLKSTKVSTDSRKIENGCIFFALKGANFNGNKYAHDALKKGAAYAVVDEAEYATDDKILPVDDVLTTLQQLAHHHRKQLGLPILAITGTNGKTTTKELISTVLAKKFKVSFTQGNLNNHIGVPLTLLAMDKNTEFGVVEMGANHPGEIADLCKIADPDFGIITNIGRAHLEGFGSFEGVIKTKGELYDYLGEKNGVVFYNADNKLLEEIGEALPKRISYGKENASFTGETIQSPPFLHVKANFKKGVLYLNSNLIGDFNFENILAAACIGNYFDVDPLEIQQAIKEYHPTNNRSQLINKGELKIIMDAYNANPTSMAASIESFLENLKGDKYLILGDMLELGEYSEDEHTKIVELIPESLKVSTFLVGKEFSKVNTGEGIKSFIQVDDLCGYLKNEPIKNGNILIKGSRGIQLEKVLDLLN